MKKIFEAIKDKAVIGKIENEIKKISIRDYLVFKIGIETGLKLNEILSLIVKDIDDNFKINPDLLIEIVQYITKRNKDNEQYIFTSEISKKNTKLNDLTVNRSFIKACEVLKIEKISGQTIRKTFGYWYYKENNRDISFLQNLFNHSAPSVTYKYIGLDNREVKKRILKNIASEKNNFIGRKKELKQLFKYMKPLKSSNFGGVVYIDGEAGIGKTYLIEEFKKQVSENNDIENINFFYLPSDEKFKKSLNPVKHFFYYYFNQSEKNTAKLNKSNFDIGYKKFISSIEDFKKKILASDNDKKDSGNTRSYEQFQDVKDIIAELIRTKSIIGALVDLNWKKSLYEELDGKARYENTIYAVKNFIKASTLLSPVILQLEDAHWIDEDTKKLLKILTQNVDNFPFMIFSVNRYTDDKKSEVKLGLPEVKENRVKLEKFSEAKVKEFVKGFSKSKEIDKKYFSVILEKSEGNPFYLNQFINSDIDYSKEVISLSKTILGKIDKLAENKREIIKTAAVMGNKIDTTIMKSIFKDMDIYEIKDGFFDISSQKELSFNHALIKDVIYASLADYEKHKIHKEIAVTIENKYRKKIKNYYEEIAYHYEGGAVTEKAKSYLEKAANFSKTNYSNERALRYYEKLLSYLDKDLEVKNKSEVKKYLKVQFEYGTILQLTGKIEDAFSCYETILLKAKEHDNITDIGRIHSEIGNLHTQKGKFEDALKSHKKSLKIYTKEGNKRGQSLVLTNIGAYYIDMMDYGKPLKYLKKALKLSKEFGDSKIMSAALNNIGGFYLATNNFDKALEYFERDLKINKQLGNREALSITTGQIGLFYQGIGDYDKAIVNLTKAVKISEELGQIHGILGLNYYLGEVQWAKRNFTKAMDCYKIVLKNSEEIGSIAMLFYALYGIAIIYKDSNNYIKSMEYFDKATVYVIQLGVKPTLSHFLYCKASLFYKMKDYNKSKEIAKESYRIAKDVEREDFILDLDILAEKNNFKLSENIDKKLKCIENLKSLLSKLKNNKEKEAEIHYEVAILLHGLKLKDFFTFKDKAVTIFKEPYNNKPRIDFKNNYEELEKLKHI